MPSTRGRLLKGGDRVLFQGDSITNAFRMPQESNDSYQMGAGFAMMIAARVRCERPQDRITFMNRGISGQGIQDLLARWMPDCLDLKPDVLSLLIGVNDSHELRLVEEWGRHYRRLLAMTREELPKIWLILCEPFLLPCGCATEAMLRNMTERQREFLKITREEKAVAVFFQKAFDRAMKQVPADYWAYDGIHPTAAGAKLLARTWLEVVG